MTSVATEALAYHRLALARQRSRWWNVLLTGVVGVVFYLAINVVLVVVFFVWSVLDPTIPEALEHAAFTGEFFDPDQPWLFLALIVPLILMIPALLLASRLIEGRGVGLLSSVIGRLRWRWMWETLVIAVIVYALYFGVMFTLAALAGEEITVRAEHPNLWLMLVLVLVLIPFQAAAEEYVFRGYLMQLIGRWLKHPAFAILLPAPLFVLGHGYDIWGGLSVGVFGVVAAWLCWRTGGLEAAISVHAVNNIVVFLFGAVELVDANATTGAPLDVVYTAASLVVYALVVQWWAKRRGIAVTLEWRRLPDAPALRPAPPAAVPTAYGTWQPPVSAPGFVPGTHAIPTYLRSR